MKTTIKAFQFMSKLFLTEKEAVENSTGWEHKEAVKTVYISIDQNELTEIKNLDNVIEKIEMLECSNHESFETYEEAEKASKEWNE